MNNDFLKNNQELISDEEIEIFSKIKNMLLQPCNMIQTVSLSVHSYQEVIDLWINYKNNDIEIQDYLIESAFIFHKNQFDHILLYHSNNLDSTLLMCKVGEKYKNITIDNDEMKNIDYFKNFRPNFIATYY